MLSKPKLMIVGDKQFSFDFIRTQFEEFDVTEADNGRIALKTILEDKPDIVLMDVMMPGIDGYSVLSIMKNSPETRFIPVILITDLNGPEEKAKLQTKGANDFIVRPFNPAEIQTKVRSLLQVKYLNDELDEVQNLLVWLTATQEEKNVYFVGQSKRVSRYATRLARKQLLNPLRQEEIKMAALLRDIGNICIEDGIFLKPDKLTDEEYAIVKSHPIKSERICSALLRLKPALPFIRHHHERFDGDGYPDGLKGVNIPLGARIIAIVEAYDALTSDRPYRQTYTAFEATVILRNDAGKQWDPDLAELFCQMVEDGTLQINE